MTKHTPCQAAQNDWGSQQSCDLQRLPSLLSAMRPVVWTIENPCAALTSKRNYVLQSHRGTRLWGQGHTKYGAYLQGILTRLARLDAGSLGLQMRMWLRRGKLLMKACMQVESSTRLCSRSGVEQWQDAAAEVADMHAESTTNNAADLRAKSARHKGLLLQWHTCWLRARQTLHQISGKQHRGGSH